MNVCRPAAVQAPFCLLQPGLLPVFDLLARLPAPLLTIHQLGLHCSPRCREQQWSAQMCHCC
eukprot:358777-Chlamydomonas_euryale.AAC.2